MERPKGPFCQSCSMPMEKPEDFGTDEKADEVGTIVTIVSRMENLQILI